MPLTQPIFLVTDDKTAVVSRPDNWYILFLQNIISLLRKDFIPTIWSPTSTVPAELPVKFSGDSLVL